MDYRNIPVNANKIICRTIYKVKEVDDGSLRLKSHTVIHGNRDKVKYSVRRDSASADLSIVRLALYLGVNLGFCFGTADVKGAYIQSGPIRL